ncbi:MAG: glycolate oxidase subunit GlcF [Gammaproteobacteria bacterium]|nr:glycolate oxidase subunit GlcF [Gammaproteobacteria bacterium]
MQTSLADFIRDTDVGREADKILRSCVHCGFCNATCPTYQLLGNELDGPRGRIYLIKQVLEGHEATAKTLTHLDRCLTCRNCETTCPSGVEYGHLVDIGRRVVEEQVKRPWLESLQRLGIKHVFSNPTLVTALLGMGRTVRALLPAKLRQAVPVKRDAGQWPAAAHTRKMMVLSGCVQSGAAPQINIAAARILDRLGISLLDSPASGCCGALEFHLNDQSGGLGRARQNIDVWNRALDSGVEAIVMTASGCGSMVKDYAHLLRDDAQYAAKAKRVVDATKDLFEVLAGEPLETLKETVSGTAPMRPVGYHAPCSLQHAQRLGDVGASVLSRLGFQPLSGQDAHLCCGSAGSYSLLQPKISGDLRERKVRTLEATDAELIVTANIGCMMHIQAGTQVPVRHWAEAVAARL